MRKFIFVFILILVSFISCNKTSKFQGKWTNSMLKNTTYNNTRNLLIENDSIKFSHMYFDYWASFPLSIEKNKLIFNDFNVSSFIEKDTLTLNDSIYYIRDTADTLFWAEIKLSISLPKTSHLKYPTEENNGLNFYINYGKRLTDSKFVLQLNDRLFDVPEFHQLINFTNVWHHEVPSFPNMILFIDEDSTMGDVDKILYYLSIANQPRVAFVNNMKLNINDSIGIFFKNELLEKRIPPLHYNKSYVQNSIASDTSQRYPPPPPPEPSFFWPDDESSKINVFSLINNEIYFNNTKLDFKNFESLISTMIQKNEVIITLFDLASTYGFFIDMNSVIHSMYLEQRDKLSEKKYDKSYFDLTSDNSDSIKILLPMKHIWNFSIPHFNSVIDETGSFYGLNVKKIDSFDVVINN